MKKGVLLINLGSPKSTSVKDVKKYLNEFLMDERVIDIPYWKRFLLIKGIILQTRPKKAAEAYKKIWWKEGSPLVIISERFTKKIQEKATIPVTLAMRYGNMNIKKGFETLTKQGVNDILIIPLYPHFAISSTETVTVKVEEIRQKYHPKLKTTVLSSFYNHPDYIKVMGNNIKKHLANFEYDHILFSYHGLPERHILKADPTKNHCKLDGNCCNTPSVAHQTCYRHQCFETTKEITKTLGLKKGTYSNSFQSRMLKDPWLKPYTDFEFERLVKKERKEKLVVITPSFVADCLETLEEIAIEGKKQFLNAGGKTYKHITCLNDNDDWVTAMTNWIEEWNSSYEL